MQNFPAENFVKRYFETYRSFALGCTTTEVEIYIVDIS